MAPETAVMSTTDGLESPPQPAASDAMLSSTFISRVSNLPIVNSALQSAWTLYDTSKNKYQLLDHIETSVKTRVVPQFQPIVQSLHAYDAQLAQIDSYACSGLDILETQLPIIKEPTNKVIETTRALMDERIVAPVKNVTTNVTTTITRSIEGGKHAVEERLKSPYVTEVFTFTEHLADRLLGPDENAKPTSNADMTPLGRVQSLGHSVSTRLTKQAVARLPAGIASVNLPTAVDPKNLAVITDLIKYSNQILSEHLAWLEQTIVASQKHIGFDQQQLAASATAIAQNLVNTLVTTSAGLATLLPESVRARSSRLQTLLQQQLSHLHMLQLKQDSVFFQKLTEAATTGQKYLETVTAHLTHFYTSGKATYTADVSPSNGTTTYDISEPTELVDEAIVPELVQPTMAM